MLHLRSKCAHPFERISRVFRQLRLRSESGGVDVSSTNEAKPSSTSAEHHASTNDAACPPQPAPIKETDNRCQTEQSEDVDMQMATVALIQRLRTDQQQLTADVRFYRNLQRTTWTRLKGTRRLIYLCQHNRLEKRKAAAKEQLIAVRAERRKAEYEVLIGY